MTAKASIAIAIVSALGGAALALQWNAYRSSTPLPKKSKEFREEFVPSQELGLSDATGAAIANLTVSDDVITLTLYTGGEQSMNVNMYQSGRSVVLLYGKSRSVMAVAEDDGYTFFDSLGSKGAEGQWPEQRGHSTKLDFDGDSVLPTVDLVLRERDGRRFAVGMSQSGDPGMAFADENGVVRDVWVQRKPIVGSGPEWWDFAVFDKKGNLRLSVEMRTDTSPNLTVFPEEAGEFYVDFKSGKLAKKQNNSDIRLDWLSPMKVSPHRPITLTNNRGLKLWSAP